ncbi:MAG: FAD-dependent oxidoreductase [Planctomycetota bacterium]|jgi:hypothetical protein
MNTVTVPAREIAVLEEADVCVAGAGVGGVAAAVAAARAGARTVLLERHGFPGGVATAGLMCSVSNHFVTRDGQRVGAGFAREFVDRLVREGGCMGEYARAGQPQVPNDPETVKRVMIEMLKEAGVRTLYGVLVTRALADADVPDTVGALVCEAKGGPFAVRARNYVDATGDLDLFALAGGPTEPVRGFATLLFRMAGVDIDAVVDWFEKHPESYSPQADIPTSLADTVRNWRECGVFHLPHYAGREIAVVRDAIEGGELRENFGRHTVDLWAMGMFACRANRGTVLVNSCAFRGDESDVRFRSECEEEGRLVAKVLADFLVRRFPGFASAWIEETAAEVGSRFTRKLVGRRTLTMDELLDGARFEDGVGHAHEVDRRGKVKARSLRAGDIPFDCLVAERPTNVICGSGKGASTDRVGLLRSQMGCMVIGQAAGAAAAVASRAGAPVTGVDIGELGGVLAKQNACSGAGG